MTKQEIKKAIENGESVWIIGKDIEGSKRVRTIKLNNNYDEVLNNKLNGFWTLNKIFKTKAEAEHYLHHANVTRTETLPFLSWEEFLKEIELKFIACDGVSNMTLYYCDNTIYLVDDEYPEFNTTSWELTEQNFYKAYDECVRLFKGE